MNDPQIYEVFTRAKDSAPMVHAGNITAPGPDLALIYAREVYGRRGESVTLWVVPRAAIQVLDDRDILHPALERSYRTVEGYRMRDKLRSIAKDDAGRVKDETSDAGR